MGSKESKKGYGWLKSWAQQHLAVEGQPPGDAAEALAEAVGPEALERWLPRLFWESREEERKGILRKLVPSLGGRVVPLLLEVLASPQSGLEEKRIAFDRLEALEQGPDAVTTENLRKAEHFVLSLPERLGNASGSETAREEALALLRGLSPLYQGVVLRELVRRPAENGFAFLEGVLDGEEDLWEAVLEDLEEAPQEEAGRLLQAGYGRAGKALRKKIRRVHHRRSARGLPVRDLETEGTGEAVWRPPASPKPEGLLSLPDPGGIRMAWVIRPNVRKGMLVFGGWIEDQRGLVKFFVMDPSRKELDRYKASLLANPEVPVVECDAGFCASLLEEAYQKGAPPDPEEAEAYKATRSMLKEVVPSVKPEAPVYAVFPEEPGGTAGGEAPAQSASLLNEPLLSGWAIAPQKIQPHLADLEAVAESRIIVHPMQKKERMDRLFRDTAGAILSDPAYRLSWARRLEDAAWVFYKRDLSEQARRLARVSRYLRDPEKDASKISFFVELVRRQMEGQLQQKKTEEKQRPSLIVKPS